MWLAYHSFTNETATEDMMTYFSANLRANRRADSAAWIRPAGPGDEAHPRSSLPNREHLPDDEACGPLLKQMAEDIDGKRPDLAPDLDMLLSGLSRIVEENSSAHAGLVAA